MLHNVKFAKIGLPMGRLLLCRLAKGSLLHVVMLLGMGDIENQLNTILFKFYLCQSRDF